MITNLELRGIMQQICGLQRPLVCCVVAYFNEKTGQFSMELSMQRLYWCNNKLLINGIYLKLGLDRSSASAFFSVVLIESEFE